MDEARSTDGDDDSPAADHAVTPVAPDEDPPAADPEPADSDQDEGVAPDREAPEAADSDESQNAAEPVAPDPDASEIDAGDVREQLLRSEAERLQLEQRLEHESESSRQILEAHATAEGRLAELEGVLTGTQAVRARAESERDELERRLNVEIAARGQEHDERVADAEHRIEALSALLEKQAQETEAERAEHERRAAADGTRIAELEERLKEELAQAAGHAEELQEELRLAREDLRPRAARKLAELQVELEDEREERTDLELRLATLTEAHKALEQARAQESAAARERIAELEPALDEARTGWERAWGELDVLGDRIAETEGTLRERERERDNAVKRVAEVQRALHEAEDGIAVLERALASVTGERDRIETARRVLEARIAARDEAERAFLAERELERRVARSQRQQLTRAERRMTEIASGLGVAMRRLDAPPQPGYDGAPQPPRQVGTAPATYAQPAAQPLPPAVAQVPAQAYLRPGATPPAQAYAAPQAVPPAQTYAAPATATPAPSYPGPHAPVAAGAPPAAPAPPVRPGPAPVAGTPAAAQRTMASGFLRAAERFAARPALEVAGATLSYAELRDRAASIAATLRLQSPTSDPPLTAVFAHRSATAFAGVLGTLMRGHGYMPLNRTLPVARTRTMFERAECQAIVVDAESSAQLPELLADAPHPVVVLVPDVEDVGELRRALP
ncbi:MAG TPA: AMP-binding protein, partial [Solirubrobacteraceae bacterium]